MPDNEKKEPGVASVAFEHHSKASFVGVGSQAMNVIEGGQNTSPR